MNPFPIPVVALGAGSQPDEPPPDYLPTPGDMRTFSPPSLREGGDPAARTLAEHALSGLLAAMQRWRFGSGDAPELDLLRLLTPVRLAINELLGEGEVSAIATGTPTLRILETVFAGVWRIVGVDGDKVVSDLVRACPVPAELRQRALAATMPAAAGPAPGDDVMNAPSVLAELAARAERFREGDAAHVVNLSLLPMSPADHVHLSAALGGGSVQVLSRGYGNCRISSTARPNTWWVQYFNSVDTVILSTIEVTALPDVVPAAEDDFADSIERLGEWLATLRQWEER